MAIKRYRAAIVATTAIALVASAATASMAQNASRPVAKNEVFFIDGKTLTITNGVAKEDLSAHVARLAARDIGPGAIIFRANDKLYVVDTPPLPLYALNDDRQRSYGGLNDDGNDRQRSYGGLNDDRQRSYGLNDDRQRSYGLNDDRQRSYGLNDDRQRSYGLNDDRQRSYGLNDDRQRSYGFNDDRQRSYGGMYDPDYVNYRLKKAFEEMTGSEAAAVPPAAVPPAAAPSAPAVKK